MDSYPGYLGLLKWSLAHGNDGTTPSEGQRMTEEDKAWLQEAFAALTVDEGKRMKDLLLMLAKSDTEDLVDEKLTAFEELEYLVESLDNARDMCTVGGLRVLGPLLASEFPELRAATADIVAVISQNNPKVQDACLAANFMPALIQMTINDPDTSTRAKTLFALSCMVRDHLESLESFITCNGLAAIASALDLESCPVKLIRRGVFFLRHLAAVHPRIVMSLTRESIGILHQLAKLCQFDDHDARENAFNVFLHYLTVTAPNIMSSPIEPSPGPVTVTVTSEGGGGGSGGSGGSGGAMVCVNDAVPPAYERIGICVTPPIELKKIVQERLAVLTALTGDDADCYRTEREVCEALNALMPE